MATYTFFIVNITTIVFIAIVYAFAFIFLRQKFYLGLAIGWLLNAAYLLAEIPMSAIRDEVPVFPTFGRSFGVVALGLLPSVWFHITAKLVSARHKWPTVVLRPLILGLSCWIITALASVFGTQSAAFNGELTSALLSLPAALYSFFVLMLIAILFSHSFPDEDFGYASRVLSGSWAAYALYQLLYPLRFFPELSNVLHLIFILALATKVAGVVALLNVLHVYYESAQEQATHASVLADLGNVAAGLHHDIATPLAVIDSELDQLARDQGEERRISQFLQRVNPSMQALYGALKVVDLARLNKSAEDQVTPTSARDAVNRAINLFRSQFPQAPLKIYVPGEVTYYVRAQVAILSQAFLNIIKNAHEAGAASLAIQIEKTGTTPGRVRFLFQNNGKLMSAEELRLCMKPGWSTKRQELGRANVGMGLYMTSKYVAIHRGEIKIKNREEKPGVEVIVEIPGSRSKSKGIEDT